MSTSSLPELPVGRDGFIPYLANPKTPVVDLLAPYKTFDTKIRELFAQEPDHVALQDPLVNVIPVFGDGSETHVKIRARDLATETQEEKDKYMMPLSDEDRMADGTPAIVDSLKEFQQNFNVFTELALSDLDWNNLVVAGSAAVTPLIPVPEKYRGSKRALRQYYHEILAPASDVDIFLYGMDEEQAKEKIKQIETKVRDAILQETTTIRTKHAITIASSYPTRHIQIVLRIYKSMSEVLTGFDVDCSCVCYDGKQIYMAPRALAAFVTQINPIDLTRRSPSYENRLSKYSHRGFEVFWKDLDRSRIDPTIFERSFQRLEGLSRLLVLEKLPKASDRETYLAKRREERGRPALTNHYRRFHDLRGDIKAQHEDEVAEWVDQEEVSNYHTFTIPYGEKFNARKIEKLLYTKDLLLNAEWNKPKDREVHLHRHPAFFGHAEDVFEDCCGYCPKPSSPEEEEVAETESKIYVSGPITFLKDDAGRQSIGSFNPITDSEWATAYVGNTAVLCQAIVDHDLEHVEAWLKREDADVNQRDYTGRTPLHLAVMSSTPEIVNCLVKNGARLVARIVDGRTALHLAALRGDPKIVKIIMEKSEANEAEEELQIMRRKDAKAATKESSKEKEEFDADKASTSASDEEAELIDAEDNSDDGMQSVTTGSFVKVSGEQATDDKNALPEDGDEEEPDFYDVNVVAWDTPYSPLHIAIVNGHTEVVKMLCADFGADVLLPVKLFSDYDKSPRAAILTLVLALSLPLEQAKVMAQTLLDLGATSAQADLKQITAFHYYVDDGPDAAQILLDNDTAAAIAALKHIVVTGSYYNPSTASPLLTAIHNRDAITALKLLDSGAAAQIEFASWIKSAKISFEANYGFRDDPEQNMNTFHKSVDQPLCVAIDAEQPSVATELLEQGADPNTLTRNGAEVIQDEYQRRYRKGETVLDQVRDKLKSFREYGTEEKEDGPTPPEPLKDYDHYITGLEPGSYKYWVVTTGFEQAKSRYESDLKTFRKLSKEKKETVGKEEKQQAINDMVSAFENLEKRLLEKGSKTFEQLHPNIKCEVDTPTPYKYEAPKPKAFEASFGFAVGDLTDRRRELYLELFQAAWDGELETVKRLTLMSTGEKEDEPPLQIAVRDYVDLSPFSIAVLRGHLDTAAAILEISRAQYVPKEKKGMERYSLNQYSSDEGDSDDDGASDRLAIYREIVDDTFTIDNIGEASLQVKSSITPLTFFNWTTAILSRFADLGADVQHKISKVPRTLLAWAIALDKKDLLVFLINLGAKYTIQKDDDGSGPRQFYNFGASELNFALDLGHTHLVAEILRLTGCGLPLDDLVKKSGIEIKEKPKYYQGLSIHGAKRADWAAQGRNLHVAQTGPKTSLTLIAAHQGSIESVEFLLSDTPIRLYSEFAKTFEDDKRLKHLSKASGGIANAVSKWLATGSHLLLHAAVLAQPGERQKRLIDYLLQSGRSALNVKTKADQTPLMLAYMTGDVDSAKMLIEAGASQSTHAFGNNLVHGALASIRPFKANLSKLSDLLDLLDPKLLGQLFLQRNSVSHSHGATPLHLWLLNSGARMETDFAVDMLKLLLKYSQGKELAMICSAGETPLHTLVACGNVTLAKVLVDFDPDLLCRENATGRTPAEVAQDMCLATKFSGPRELNRPSFGYGNRFDAQDIIDRDAATFAKGEEKDERSSQQKMWDLCREVMEKHAQKRRLVSLPEANEVAKRLGEITKKNRSSRGRIRDEEERGGGDVVEEEEEGGDPLPGWLVNASTWACCDEVDEDESNDEDES